MSESVLRSEIAEQPEVIARLLRDGAAGVEAIAAGIRGRGVHHVVMAARGSSDNAARYAQYLFGAHNRLTVTLATPSLFTRYQAPPLMTGALVVGRVAVRRVARPGGRGGGGAAAGLPDAGHHERRGIAAHPGRRPRHRAAAPGRSAASRRRRPTRRS